MKLLCILGFAMLATLVRSQSLSPGLWHALVGGLVGPDGGGGGGGGGRSGAGGAGPRDSQAPVTEEDPDLYDDGEEPDEDYPEEQPDQNATESQPNLDATERQPDQNATESQPNLNATESQPNLHATESQPDQNATERQPNLVAIKSQRNLDPNGDYQFSFDTENGIHFEERSVGKLVRDERNEEHLVPSKQGSYSWFAPDGVQYTVTYVADEFGFRPSGAHLPTPPPIPVQIQRSLDYIKSVQPNRK